MSRSTDRRAAGGDGTGLSAAPRDRFITVYGRNPVLEALLDERATIDKVVLAHGARGDAVDQLLACALRRGVRVERADALRVTRLSRNGRQDQGVVADIVAPGQLGLGAFLDEQAALEPPARSDVLVLDALTNPANVGMCIRTAAAAGMVVVLPRFGSPELGPLVVKASAGVALRAVVLRADDAAVAVAALRSGGWTSIGLAADGPVSLWSPLPRPCAIVVGNESVGLSPDVNMLLDERRSIPLAEGVESLNSAVAAGVACLELSRQRAGC